MGYKFSLISLGCEKNTIDSEQMIGLLIGKGYDYCERLEECEIIIVNTCSFINDAMQESIDTILEVAELKKVGKCKALIVAGCLAQRYKNLLFNEMPEIDGILGTGSIYEVDQIVKEALINKKTIKVDNLNNTYNDKVKRCIKEGITTAYVKIAEGCNNYCSYCIIPKIRGKYRSRRIESIVDEVKSLVQKGIKEIILIAQDTSKYGIDLYSEYKLPELLRKLNCIEGLKWIRLLYLYPETLTDDTILSIKECEKVVKYVDIPIQHANDRILSLMNRKCNKNSLTMLINKLRHKIPNIIIRTTLIVGFPTETDEEFQELYDFVKNSEFDRLGVFTYSKEEDTAAAEMDNHIDEETKYIRKDIIMRLQKDISYNKNVKKLNKVYEVLVEDRYEDGIYIGRTYMDSPEIDGIVYIHSKKNLEMGSFVNVKINDVLEYDLIGEIYNEFSK